MRRVTFPLIAILLLAFIINGCKIKQEGEDQEKTERVAISVDKKDLTRTWLRISPGSNPEEYEGFSLDEDGSLTYQNTSFTQGDTWALQNDTLILSNKTDDLNTKRSNYFIIYEIGENKLVLKPMKSSNQNTIEYQRSEVSLVNLSPEDVLDAYIYFINKADEVGVQSIMIIKRRFSISTPMNITDYKIISTTKLTEQEAAAIPISPKVQGGDIQLNVEQIIGGSNNMKYTYWMRHSGIGNWGLVIWSYTREI